MTDDKLQSDISRGARAAALINDPLIAEAFDKLEKEYIALWRRTEVRDQDARERLFIAVNQVAIVRSHLNSVLDSGKLAQKQLDELVSRPKRFGIV